MHLRMPRICSGSAASCSSACTRARDHLYVSYTGEPSEFLAGVT